MDHLKDQKLATLALKSPSIVEVFEKYNLDYCCRGTRTLEEACLQQNLDLNKIVAELQPALEKTSELKIDFEKLSPADLARYIQAVHHTYVRQKVPVISSQTVKVAMRHHDHHPELQILAERWQLLSEELMQHLMKEEQILFPFIEKLQKAFNSHETFELPEQDFIARPIQMMENEHTTAGNLMAEIRTLANDYNAPEQACTTWRLMLSELREFEKDLHQHVHLENFLLFPKALEMEKEIFVNRKSLQN